MKFKRKDKKIRHFYKRSGMWIDLCLSQYFIFSHPDFTVGLGVSPNRLLLCKSSQTLLSVWNFTNPQRYLLLLYVLATILILSQSYIKFFDYFFLINKQSCTFCVRTNNIGISAKLYKSFFAYFFLEKSKGCYTNAAALI